MNLKVGVLGCGAVGGGLIELLVQRGDRLGLQLARVGVRDPNKPRPEVPLGVPVGTLEEVLDDGSLDVIVELIGGLDPAYRTIRSALERGRAVVTANKAVVAAYGNELRALAAHYHVGFRYEASVAGCLPIVEILENDLIFDRVDRLFGILNGTCNFILTRCSQDDLQYAEALREAQQRGFAEADPTLDVSGLDTAQKLSILVTLLAGGSCSPSMVSTTGIVAVGSEDHRAAEELGYAIKLLACYRRGDPSHLRVAPTLVPKRSALGLTVEEYNAVEVECAHIGWQLYLGKGAGRMPTASAVLHDLVRIRGSRGAPQRVPSPAPLAVAEPSEWRAPWMLRLPEGLAVPRIEMVELRRTEVGTLIVTEEMSEGEIRRVQAGLTGASCFAIELDV